MRVRVLLALWAACGALFSMFAKADAPDWSMGVYEGQ